MSFRLDLTLAFYSACVTLSAQPAAPVLDEWLCLALYNASRAMTARYRPLLAEHGLTYPQYLVLTVLREQDGVTVGQIGDRLRLDSGTVSPLLHRLEQARLVARTRAAYDERLTLVCLTEQGKDVLLAAANIPDAVCASVGMTPAEQAPLVEALHQLIDQLDGSGGGAVQRSK